VRRDDGFAEFVSAATPALSRTAYLLTGDHQLAEDLLQSALANAFRHWPRIRDGHPEAYVRRSLHHEQVSWWRRRRGYEHLTPNPGAERSSSDGDLADATTVRITVVRALATLTPRQRAVIVLRFYEDLTEAAAARVLGCTVGSVKRHGHEALARLRRIAPHLLDGVREEHR
jgi:RNA polymerase sigma-70 factor (sigma-E family)